MFSDINRELLEAKENVRKKLKYEEHLQRVTEFLRKEEKKRDKLKQQLLKEKEDVARLEGFSLTNIFYTITGRKLEKIEKEQQEVLSAKLKYNESLETIEDIEQEIKEYNQKLERVVYADKQYETIIKKKEQLIHDTNSIWSEELFAFAEKEADIFSNIKEFNEAIDAGEKALYMLEQAIKSLDSAKGWSTFDMLGGGMITTAIKHSRLDNAKDLIHQAQNRLRHFQEELLDIGNHFDIKLEIGGMLTFADYFFDGIVVDWVVHGRISDCYNQTLHTRKNVGRLLEQLKEQRNRLHTELETIQHKRESFLESAN